jgi:hypothetical protein
VRTKQTEAEWLKSGGYLPRFFRDFHAQKGVFKWIWRSVERRRSATGEPVVGAMSWVDGHIFVIDFFLWCMARHGYTLQPIKKDWPMADWRATVRAMEDEDAAAFRAMLDREKAAPTEEIR